MFKFSFDLGNVEDEIIQGIESRFKSAVNQLQGRVQAEGQKLAAVKLKAGLAHWERGFKVHKVDNDFFVVSIDGRLANWMEDGIQAGEISKSIMSGNRASYNKSQGKKYVDVPIAKDADALGNITLGKKGPAVNVKAFKDADSLIKSVTLSDWKKGGVKQEKRVVSRVQDIIKSTKPSTGKTSYMTIRRVTENSVWPKSPFKGAKVLEELDKYIDQEFDRILENLL